MTKQNLRTSLKSQGFNLGKLANAVGVDKATVTRWFQRRIPAERVLDVERITGLSRQILRPDIYPTEDPPE